MNLVAPAGTLVLGLAGLAIVLVVGWASYRLLRARPARTAPPSLVLPYRCPRCRRRDFETLGDVPRSRPPAIFARCRNCGTRYKLWYPGQWEQVTGDEVEDPTPEPRPRSRQLTLRRVMLVIALTAVFLSIPAKMAWLARLAGRPFGVADWLLMGSLPWLDLVFAYVCWLNAPSLPSPRGFPAWILWLNTFFLLACSIILSAYLIIILFLL